MFNNLVKGNTLFTGATFEVIRWKKIFEEKRNLIGKDTIAWITKHTELLLEEIDTIMADVTTDMLSLTLKA